MKKLICACICVLLASLTYVSNASNTDTITYEVGRGETLQSIAEKFGVTESQIIELNPDASQFIYVGMELIIPTKATKSVTTDPKTNDKKTDTPSTDFKVQPDETPQKTNTIVYDNKMNATKDEKSSIWYRQPLTWFEGNLLYSLESSSGYEVSAKEKMNYGLTMNVILPIDDLFGLGFHTGFQTNLWLVDTDASSSVASFGPMVSIFPEAEKRFFISIPLCGYWKSSQIVDLDKTNQYLTYYKNKDYFGFLTIPQLNLKLNSIVISLGAEVTFAKKVSAGLFLGFGFTYKS